MILVSVMYQGWPFGSGDPIGLEINRAGRPECLPLLLMIQAHVKNVNYDFISFTNFKEKTGRIHYINDSGPLPLKVKGVKFRL